MEDFLLIEKISDGTYGVVYKGKNKKTAQFVALKIIRGNKMKQYGIPSTCIREISFLKDLNHPNIVRLEHVLYENSDLCLIFEFLDMDLKGYMDCLGPCKVADFALSRGFSTPLRVYTKDVVILWYKAPELLLGTRRFSCPVDIWAMGCIFAEMTSKKALFQGESDIDQLCHMFRLLGTPSEEILPGVSELPDYKTTFPSWPAASFRDQISTELVIENPREVRQSNFAECCPCPDLKQDAYPGPDTTNTHIATSNDDSCSCRLASDSESASSLINPIFRKMDQHNRPLSSKKEDPTPLLKPEVGLASSVLETLKEVTDQEYQEAVARDAARSALLFMESEPLEDESRNLMKIILNPNAERSEDIISDTEYFQESGYNRPLLSNSFEQMGSQSPLKMLGKIFSSPKLTRKTIFNKNHFDMDDDASNIQRNILRPVKNSVLDQMKLKADGLKLKLFPNIEDRLKNQAFKDFIQIDSSTNNLLTPLKHILKNAENTEPSNFNNEKTNGRHQIVSQNRHDLFNLADPRTLQTFNKHTKDLQPSDNIVRISKFSDEDLFENTVSPEIENPTTVQLNKKDMINLDDQTRTWEVNNIDNIVGNTDNVGQNELSETLDNLLQDTNIDNNNVNSNSGRLNTKTITNDLLNLTSSGSVNDSKFESSIISNQNETSQNKLNKKLTLSPENINKIENFLPNDSEHRINEELLSTSYEHKNPTDFKALKLPYMKADILKTLEHFQKANEKIQEKLKSNVQDALRAVVEKTESAVAKRISVVNKQNNDNNPYPKDENNVNIQDLQNMSDSLLKQSYLKENGHNLESSELSKSTEKVFDSVNVFPLLAFSNNTNNLEYAKINSSNQEPNPNLIDEPEKEKKNHMLCNNEIMPNSSVMSNMNNEINEMDAQSSNSVLNTMAQLRLNPSVVQSLSRHRIMQPGDANKTGSSGDITDFLGNNKISSTSTFKDVGISNLGYLLNADKNIEPQNFNSGESSIYNAASNLNSYKTKVASPKSLNLKSEYSSPKSTDDVLALPSQNYPASILRYPSEDNFVTKILRNNGLNELNPPLRIPQGKFLTDKLSSIVPCISDNIRSRTNNALKSVRESLDASVNKPININKNTLFSKPLLSSENLLDEVLKKRKNLNDRLDVFKTDVNKRLTSNLLKIPFENVGLNPNRLSISDNSAEFKKPLEIKPTFLRNTFQNLRGKKPVLLSNKSTDVMPEISKPSLRSNIKKKLESLTHELNLNSNKGSVDINRPKSYHTKTLIANRNKLKPLKENKIIIRSDPNESNIRPTLKMSHLKSRTPNLAQLTRNLPRLEPKVLASNDLISKVPYPDSNLKGQKITNQPYSDEEFAVPQGMKNNKHISKAKQGTLVLPKFKNAFAAKSSNQDKNHVRRADKSVDGTESASNNIDRSATVVEPLKENTSYKCKMVCIKDILDIS